MEKCKEGLPKARFYKCLEELTNVIEMQPGVTIGMIKQHHKEMMKKKKRKMDGMSTLFCTKKLEWYKR